MARDWPRLVLAAAIAFAVAGSTHAVAPALAQTEKPPTKPAKKTAKKAADAEQDKDEQGQPKKKKQDPAEAQKSIEAAQKLIENGKVDAGATSLTTTLSAGNLPPGLMARALLYRGIANRQLQKPALAIQDLTQALWLKGGLGETERAEAQRQRAGAYSDAGLSDAGPRVASSDRAVTTGSNAAQDTPPKSDSGSNWNLFGNLFGSNTSSPPPPEAPKVAAPVQPKAAVSGWSSNTDVRPTAVAVTPQPVVVSEPVAAAAAVVRPDGKFRIQLGLVRSESEAGAIVARVGGELASVFEARNASIDQTVVGNMGTMYRVRVGPYATSTDGQAVCGRLKGTGLDCMVVAQ